MMCLKDRRLNAPLYKVLALTLHDIPQLVRLFSSTGNAPFS